MTHDFNQLIINIFEIFAIGHTATYSDSQQFKVLTRSYNGQENGYHHNLLIGFILEVLNCDIVPHN